VFIFLLYFYIFAAKINKNIIKNKHPEEMLPGSVLLITLIKYAQQDAEPQNRKRFTMRMLASELPFPSRRLYDTSPTDVPVSN
jgi:hypothetical protein